MWFSGFRGAMGLLMFYSKLFFKPIVLQCKDLEYLVKNEEHFF